MLGSGGSYFFVALVALAAFLAGRFGERQRFNDLLAAIRTDVAELHDAFEHWTKRERVRASRDRVERHQSQMPLALERALRRQASYGRGNGAFEETEEGS